MKQKRSLLKSSRYLTNDLTAISPQWLLSELIIQLLIIRFSVNTSNVIGRAMHLVSGILNLVTICLVPLLKQWLWDSAILSLLLLIIYYLDIGNHSNFHLVHDQPKAFPICETLRNISTSNVYLPDRKCESNLTKYAWTYPGDTLRLSDLIHNSWMESQEIPHFTLCYAWNASKTSLSIQKRLLWASTFLSTTTNTLSSTSLKSKNNMNMI